ncbi:unnamed protein product [Rhizoctonia solani]|uniref:RlpA-like protein double-psi beta-barrel domain-containing protein n=1 Tax=Rhizoctonia solani TaxID=456999 RepID=A0A8H3DIN7_9AGAM|nr:unnamed protein product [Rhizoctonia solani]
MLSSVVAAFVLAASVNQVVASPSRHLYAARAYAQDSHLLEDYDTYHARYLSIGCISAKKSDLSFFKTCCHPLAKDASSSDIPAECQSSSGQSASASPSSTATYTAPTQGSGSGSSEVISGGYATYFYQNGVAGACGTVHSDSDPIVAVDYRRYGDTSKKSDLCGKKVLITNITNGKTVTATVADACPTCENENCLDLSEGAFKSLDDLNTGMFKIKYTYI